MKCVSCRTYFLRTSLHLILQNIGGLVVKKCSDFKYLKIIKLHKRTHFKVQI